MTSQSQPDGKDLSKCCKAPVISTHGEDFGGDDDIHTYWNECSACKKPADVMVPDNSKEECKYICHCSKTGHIPRSDLCAPHDGVHCFNKRSNPNYCEKHAWDEIVCSCQPADTKQEEECKCSDCVPRGELLQFIGEDTKHEEERVSTICTHPSPQVPENPGHDKILVDILQNGFKTNYIPHECSCGKVVTHEPSPQVQEDWEEQFNKEFHYKGEGRWFHTVNVCADDEDCDKVTGTTDTAWAVPESFLQFIKSLLAKTREEERERCVEVCD